MNKLVKSIGIGCVFLFVTLSAAAQCDIPTTLSSISGVNGDGLNEVTLSWGSALGALQYSVAYRVSGSVDGYTVKSTSTTSLVITGLPASTTYEWKVRSVCAEDWSIISDYSVLEQFTTSTGTTCTTPVNLASVSSGSGSTINETALSWDAVSGAVYYSLAYRVQGTSTFTYKTLETNSYTLSGLPANTTYEWQVRTICSSDWKVYSAFSAIETFVSGSGVECLAVTNLQVPSTTASSASLTWTAAEGAEQYYIQYRLTASQSWDNADYVFTYQPDNKTINGLVADQYYETRIKTICATDGSGKWTSHSDYSSIVAFNTYECTTPGSLSSLPGATSATLSWSAVGSALQYQIKYRETGTVIYNNEVNVDGSETSVIITNLSPDTGYDWIIRSRCTLDNTINSAYSSVQTFTTLSGTECTTPTTPTATPTSSDALLQWDPVPGALEYQMKYRQAGETVFQNSVTVTAPDTSVVIGGLSSSTQYEWLVRALCSTDGSNNSSYTAIQTFTTDAGASCDTPTNLQAVPSSTSADLSWDPVASANSYRLKYRVQGTSVFSNTVTITAPTSSTTISGLTANTTYEWLIRSECTDANSSYSSIQSFTTTSGGGARVASSGSSTNTVNDDGVASSEDVSIKPDSFELYPNPSEGLIHVKLSLENPSAIIFTIFDPTGRLLYQKSYKDSIDESLDFKQLFGSGFYLVRVKSEKNNYVRKVSIR